MATQVRIHVEGYSDSDAEERAQLAWRLEEELRAADGPEVERVRAAAPPGAKGSAIEWAQLAVTFVGVIPPLVTALLAFGVRHPGASLTVEAGGERLQLDGGTPEEKQAALTAFLERHGRE